VVSALIARSRESGGSAADLVAALDGRIKSMATAHELLSGRKWQGLPLAALIERELAPYVKESNAIADGPDVVLEAEAGQALAMVVHELVTNAAKYGAFSVEQGRVSVRWRLVPENGASAHLALDWQEARGPAVSPSSHIGYGTSIIRDLVPYELGGTVDLAFPPEGVRCRLQIPAQWLSRGAASEGLVPNGTGTTPTPSARIVTGRRAAPDGVREPG
jgi:two-component sensor histidine kinase